MDYSTGHYNEENTEYNIKEKDGAYIFEDKDNDINLFLYIKSDKENLQAALPLSYDENLKNCDYLAVVIKRGADYLGQNSLENIQELIAEKDMQNILEKTYSELSKKIPNLTQEQYDNYLGFSEEQLKLAAELHPELHAELDE